MYHVSNVMLTIVDFIKVKKNWKISEYKRIYNENNKFKTKARKIKQQNILRKL